MLHDTRQFRGVPYDHAHDHCDESTGAHWSPTSRRPRIGDRGGITERYGRLGAVLVRLTDGGWSQAA